MEWFQVLTIILSVIGSVFWFQRENKADLRALQAENKVDIRAFQDEIRSWKKDIDKEMKDFHGRLCAIEERRK